VPLDLLWSDRRGELDVLVVMVRSPTTPDLAVAVALRPRSTCRSYTCRRAGRSWTKPNDASLSRCAENSIWWCAGTPHADFRRFLRRLGLPADKRLSIVHNGVHRCGTHLRAKSCVKLVGASAVTCSGSLMSSGSSEPDLVWVYDRHAVDDVTRLGADVEGQNWRGRRCGTAKTTSSRYGNQPSSPNLATRLPLCCRSTPRVETHAK